MHQLYKREMEYERDSQKMKYSFFCYFYVIPPLTNGGHYTHIITVPKDWKDREIYLYFGAVDEAAWVYVNGKLAGTHPFIKPNDWATPFTIRIDKYINFDHMDQAVVVRVEDKKGAGGIWKEIFLISKITR